MASKASLALLEVLVRQYLIPVSKNQQNVFKYHYIYTPIIHEFTIGRGPTLWGLNDGLLYCPGWNGFDLKSSTLLVAWKKYPCVVVMIAKYQDVVESLEVHVDVVCGHSRGLRGRK